MWMNLAIIGLIGVICHSWIDQIQKNKNLAHIQKIRYLILGSIINRWEGSPANLPANLGHEKKDHN